jgi:hypothetical protein
VESHSEETKNHPDNGDCIPFDVVRRMKNNYKKNADIPLMWY